MAESIGTVRIDIVGNAEDLQIEVQRAKTLVSSMGPEFEKSFAKMAPAAKNATLAALKFEQQIGKSKEELRLLSLAARGAAPEALEKVRQALLRTRDAAEAAGLAQTKAFAGTNKTARELQFAMRGLPAQVTDIVTSLASGQRPMMVLLQQGGQLKDMFGGIAPAARALGGAIVGLINPFTLAAAAVAALGVAWKQASDEADAFNAALILSGNQAGLSVDKLRAMAEELDRSTNATTGKASDVLAQVSATSKFTAEQIQLVTRAALNLQDATGRSVEQTIREFAALADKPLETILKLNDAMGDGTNVIRFLSKEQAEQIAKLQEQGREADAAALAMRRYSDAINNDSAQIVANLSTWSELWRDIAHGAKEAGDEVIGFLRNSKASNLVAQSLRNLLPFHAPEPTTPAAGGRLPITFAIPGTLAPASFTDGDSVKGAQFQKDYEERQKAREDFQRKEIQYLSDKLKMDREIADVESLVTREIITQGEAEKRIALIRADYAKKGAKSTRTVDNAEARAALQAFQDQLKVEQGAISNATQLLQAQYSARLVTVQKYYEDQRALAQRGTAAEEQALQGQIGVLKARNVTGKDAADVARQLATLEAELAKVRADGATKLAILNIQEADALKQRRLAAQAYQSALDENNAALQDQISTMVARIGMGEREFEIQSKINEAYRDQAKELLALARQRDAGELDAETYEARVAALKEATDQQVQIVRDGYDRMAEAQANWANGAIKALKDYVDQAADVAGQTYSLFTDAFKGAEDVLTDFITKGKADWKGFLDDILAESTRFAVKQQLAKIAKRFMPGLSDGEGSQAGALSSAAGELAASATPLYGAAGALSAAAAALAAAGAGSAAAGGGAGFNYGEAAGSLIDLFSGSGFGFAKGAAFAGGNVVPFASGGVVTRPTFFGMSGGRMGVMGEERPEAIVPLHRGPGGKLGIRMERDPMPKRLAAPVINQVIQVQGLMGNHTPSQMARASAEAQSKALRKR